MSAKVKIRLTPASVIFHLKREVSEFPAALLMKSSLISKKTVRIEKQLDANAQKTVTAYIYDIPWYEILTLEDGLRQAYTDLPCFDGLRMEIFDYVNKTANGKLILEVRESPGSKPEYSIIADVDFVSVTASGHGGRLLEYQNEFPMLTTLDFEGKRGNFGDPGFLFRGHIFQYCSTRQALDQQQVKLDLFEHLDNERRRYERLQTAFDGVTEGRTKSREPIPEAVRIAVWNRDGGRCVKCGSKERLEYDHIIPVSKGGSSTTRNIELLCETCNRSKSDKIQ